MSAEVMPMLAEEAKKRKGARTDLSEKRGDRPTSVPDGAEVHQRVVDWEPIRVIPLGECGLPRGFCQSCALYIWAEGGYKIPSIKGIFCSIACVECELFGPGRCRWCSASLGSTAKKWCDDHCRRQSDRVRFGDGTRLLKLLSHRYPRLYEELVGKRGHACLNCDHSLEGKPSDARFCSDRCRKKFQRCTTSRKSQKSVLYPDIDSTESIAYTTPKTRPLTTPRGRT